MQGWVSKILYKGVVYEDHVFSLRLRKCSPEFSRRVRTVVVAVSAESVGFWPEQMK